MQGITDSYLEIVTEERTISGYISPHMFSDSVLIYTRGDTPDDLLSILILSAKLFCDSLLCGVPLRGGISSGDFYVNEEYQLFCGVPFVKAYVIGEEVQWLGVVIDDVVKTRFDEQTLLSKDNADKIVKWDVPLKNNGGKSAWVLNWCMFMGYKKQPPFKGIDLYSVFERIYGYSYDHLSPDVKSKYKNTADFLNQFYPKQQ